MIKEKIDLHVHVSRFAIPAQGKMQISSAEEMLPHFKKLGIKKAVIMSAGEMNSPIGSNADNLAIVKEYPQNYAWMCNVDPVDIENMEQRIVACKEQGAMGIGELMINQRLDSPMLQEIFRIAQKYNMPVTFHMSPEVGFGYGVVDDPGLPLLEKTLQTYENLKLLGHSQSFWIEMSKDAPKEKEKRNEWGKGPVIKGGRVPELFEKYPNLYGDLSANSAGCAIMRDSDFGLAFLERFAGRLFFATDMVNNQMVFPLGAWLDEQVETGKLSQTAYDKICFENAHEIFGI